ncbi:MAG: serine/threonine protein kinase [Deltaproteobacteria bacterium]|nr:serine/threonine protein kinase [Deltaproteobacteria bacterium]
MTVTTTIPPGTVISGKYRIGRELGRGGMAAVYEAENVDIGKRVAIKILSGALASSRVVLERFLREARAVAAIRSPHICDVYDAARLDDGSPYLVLELCEGEALYDRMVRERQMSQEATLAVVLQVCRGLAKAHEAGIVHRDLKPENIFITKDDDGDLFAKILDFGLAKFYEASDAIGAKARLTREGALFGTPVYMSPEQVKGQGEADHRADLWALACISYECLTGATVWNLDGGVAMTFVQIASAPLPDPARYRPDLPPGYAVWFQRALDRDIARRPQSVQELADGLAAAFGVSAPGGGTDAALVKQLAAAASRPGSAARLMQPSVPIRLGSASGSGQPLSPPGLDAPHVAPAASDVVPTVPMPRPRLSRLRARGAAAALAVAGLALGIVALLSAGPTPAPPEPAQRLAPAVRRAAAPARATAPTPAAPREPPWLGRVRAAQQLVAEQKYEDALTKLRRAFDETRHAMVGNLIEQVQVAELAARVQAPCRVTGLGRPRRSDLLGKRRAGPAGPPAIAAGAGGLVVAWTHQGAEPAQRAYAVGLDRALWTEAEPVEITPEGSSVYAPQLLPAGERFLAVYWDAAGAAAGAWLRWLDPVGLVPGPAVGLTERRPGSYFAGAARGEKDGWVAVWAGQGDADSVDLFCQPLDASLRPARAALRLTDYVGSGLVRAKVRDPAVAAAHGRLHFAYTFARDPLLQVRYQVIPAGAEPPGLGGPERAGANKDRTLGKEVILSPPLARASDPALVCTGQGCFAVWNVETGASAGVALLDAHTGVVQWQKSFASQGAHPVLAASPSGAARVAWMQGGRLMTALADKSGLGAQSQVARVVGVQPPPSLAPGVAAGEWLVAWLDFEAGHLEPYVARIVCE